MNTQATVSQPAAVPGSPLVQVSGALLGIIVLILAVAWVIKRLGFAPKSARLVLGVTASQINVLHTLPPAPADAEEKTASPADFQAMMKSLLKRPGRS